MKFIPLTQGQFAIVDDEGYEELSRRKWCALKGSDGKYRAIRGYDPAVYMHRQIMNAPKGMDVDHINHNPLDNQKTNLRICTRSQNNQNKLAHKSAKSKYKGVHYHKPQKKWMARLALNGKRFTLGAFNNEIDAAKAYNKAATKYFGEYACLNPV